MTEEIDWSIWVERAIAGDPLAFETIYEQTRNDVYRTIAFLIVDKQDIGDVMNEVYIQLWKSLKSYEATRPFRFWLHGIVVRQVQDQKRKVWRRLRLLEKKRHLEIEQTLDAHSTVLQDETRQELVDALLKLSYKLRVVVILRYFHHYSLEEIATLLEIPLGTVKSRHHLALKELRKQYGSHIEGKVENPYAY